MGFPDHQMCNSHRMHLLISLAAVFVRCRTISFPVGVANFAKPHDSASIRCKKKKPMWHLIWRPPGRKRLLVLQKDYWLLYRLSCWWQKRSSWGFKTMAGVMVATCIFYRLNLLVRLCISLTHHLGLAPKVSCVLKCLTVELSIYGCTKNLFWMKFQQVSVFLGYTPIFFTSIES